MGLEDLPFLGKFDKDGRLVKRDKDDNGYHDVVSRNLYAEIAEVKWKHTHSWGEHESLFQVYYIYGKVEYPTYDEKGNKGSVEEHIIFSHVAEPGKFQQLYSEDGYSYWIWPISSVIKYKTLKKMSMKSWKKMLGKEILIGIKLRPKK